MCMIVLNKVYAEICKVQSQSGRGAHNEVDTHRQPSLYSTNCLIKTDRGQKLLCRMSAYPDGCHNAYNAHNAHNNDEQTHTHTHTQLKVALKVYSSGTEVRQLITHETADISHYSAAMTQEVAKDVCKAMQEGLPRTPTAEYTHFENESELVRVLSESGIDTSLFGRKDLTTKSVHDLMQEINGGYVHLELYEDESSGITKRQLLRVLHTVNVCVVGPDAQWGGGVRRRGDCLHRRYLYLTEHERTLPDGTRKAKNRSPSTKMTLSQKRMNRNAGVRKCSTECITADLGIPVELFHVHEESVRTKIKTRTSNTFPGVSGKYYIHSVSVQLKYKLIRRLLKADRVSTGLQKTLNAIAQGEPFTTKEVVSGFDVILHHWNWQPSLMM